MNDYYLKAESKEAFDAALGAAGFATEFGTIVPQGHALDVIGVIREATGEMLTSEDGIVYPELAPVPGWHVNYRGEALPAELQPFEIDAPSTPVRVWA